MKLLITCKAPDGKKVERICFSEIQSFTTINVLQHEGCHSFGRHEESNETGFKDHLNTI